jgi:hypothetical protein
VSTLDDLRSADLDVEGTVAEAERAMDGFDGTVDAVAGYWDFPVTLLVPILGGARGLPSPTLESVVRCEHKYWSRLLQSEVIDEYPAFALVDLNDPVPPTEPGYPFWLKPVKSASSELAFRVEDEKGFHAAIAELRAGIDKVGRPFEQILRRVDLPPEVAEAGGTSCLAEAALHGVQAAVEGYVHQGECVVYATLDSVDYPASPVFLRHQYPSSLPEEVRRRMASIAAGSSSASPGWSSASAGRWSLPGWRSSWCPGWPPPVFRMTAEIQATQGNPSVGHPAKDLRGFLRPSQSDQSPGPS